MSAHPLFLRRSDLTLANRLVDEWSLGITVYEILSGRSPMLSTTSEDLDRETLEREIPYPARYWKVHSHEAKDFTRRLLQKDPKQRMSVEEALRHPVRRLPCSSLL